MAGSLQEISVDQGERDLYGVICEEEEPMVTQASIKDRFGQDPASVFANQSVRGTNLLKNSMTDQHNSFLLAYQINNNKISGGGSTMAHTSQIGRGSKEDRNTHGDHIINESIVSSELNDS